MLGLLVACAAPTTRTAPQGGEVTVFAAASLTEAFTQLGTDFMVANPGTTVRFNFAGSQQLAQQLAQGAPADVFASADTRQIAAAIAADRVDPASVQVFTTNRLVVVVPADNPGTVTSLPDLATPGLKIVLADDDVPVGAYSRAFLEKAARSNSYPPDYTAAVLANVVSFEQSVKAVMTKVQLGEADAGIVYHSDVTPAVAVQVQVLTIPTDLNTVAAYPLAPISDSAQPERAAAFVRYVLSAAGQATLAEHGLQPPATTATGDTP